MTQRDKVTLFYLFGGLAALAVVVFAVYQWYYAPLTRYNKQIETLEDEVQRAQFQVDKLQLDKRKLAKYYSVLSLPQAPDKAATEYGKYLKPLLRSSGLTVDDFEGPPPAETRAPAATAQAGVTKKALHTSLTFKVRAKGTLDSLIAALKKIQATPLSHRVKTLIIDRLDPKDSQAKLGIQMTIETLIVHKAAARDAFLAPDTRLVVMDALAGLQHAPIGLAVAGWAAGPLGPRGGEQLDMIDPYRNYYDIPSANPFLGFIPQKKITPPPPPPEPEDPFDMRTQYRLSATDPLNKEAFLRNHAVQMREMRIKPRAGFDTFKIFNEEGKRLLVHAKVLRVDQRNVYFLVLDDYAGKYTGDIFGIALGQNLYEAMRRPLSDAQLETLDLMQFLPKEDKKKDKKKEPEKKGKRPKL